MWSGDWSYDTSVVRQVLLHIGTHKTGTTSIQEFCRDENPGVLEDVGAFFPAGFLIPTLHSDLALLSMRKKREWPARVKFPETRSVEWLGAAHLHVRAQIEESTVTTLVYSHEDLSYLRFDDEVTRLRGLFAPAEVRIVVFLRDKQAFLSSYRAQLRSMGLPFSSDQRSFAYVEDDTWLTDYDALVDVYARGFGRRNVEVVNYEMAVQRDGSVIPTFAALLGISRGSLPPLGRYFLNRSGAQIQPDARYIAEIRRKLT